MPRGKRKPSGFDFTIRMESGARMQFTSFPDRPYTNREIAECIRKYLYPFVERVEKAQAADAVDPGADSHPNGPRA